MVQEARVFLRGAREPGAQVECQRGVAGERTEIDFFNGYIAARGRELGVKTPLNEYLTACVKDIEAGRRKIGLGNFNEPFLEAYR
ncbi:MAG: hypothetical protein HGA94_02205 [Candidatus Aminicenantes bacterium]|nr:hypothetical protein [Candidatus Aminicenantes bacterium]